MLQATPTVQEDNDRVRVTEWRFQPGGRDRVPRSQKWTMSWCQAAMADLKLVSPEGEETFADLKHGQSYFRKAGVHHNVINASDYEFAFVEIELK